MLPPSTLHTLPCCPLLPTDCTGLLQKHFSHIFWANVSHVNSDFAFKYHGCPDHGSRTSLLLQVLSPVSTTELLELVSSKLLFVHDAKRLNLPSTEWPRWRVPPLLRGHMLPMNEDSEVELFLPAAASICPPQFQSFCGAKKPLHALSTSLWNHARS